MNNDSNSVNVRRLMGLFDTEEDFGELLGFWATSFEFDPEFFETDFLPNYLRLGVWDDHSFTTRIAMERELAKIDSAVLMMDPHGYKGRPRSLRLHIYPERGLNQNKIHPKVFISFYEKAINLVVGSANLTQSGYRSNREVVARITVTENNTAYKEVLRNALLGARNIFQKQWKEHFEQLLTNALNWIDGLNDPPEQPAEWFIWGGGEDSLWQQFLELWPLSESIQAIDIVSPFWSDETGDGPVAKLIKGLRNLRPDIINSNFRMSLFTEGLQSTEHSWIPILPESYKYFDFRTIGVKCFAKAVNPHLTKDELEVIQDSRKRKLHAKVVLLKGASTSLAYVGSANFTHHGWGFLHNPQGANVEAGLALMRIGHRRQELDELIPVSIGEHQALTGSSVIIHPTSAPDPEPMKWPSFIRSIVIAPTNYDFDSLQLIAYVDISKIKGNWSIGLLEEDANRKSHTLLLNSGEERESEFKIILDKDDIQILIKYLEVRINWWESDSWCDYPINVAPSLRDHLPIIPGLDVIDECAIVQYYQGRITWEEVFNERDEFTTDVQEDVDRQYKEETVDTSRIQSYQIRDFVQALEGISEDLYKACESKRNMRSALLGWVSPVSLATAIIKLVKTGNRTPTAAGFQIVEIIALLLKAKTLPNIEQWGDYLTEAISRVSAQLNYLREKHPNALKESRFFLQYEKSVSRHYNEDGSI